MNKLFDKKELNENYVLMLENIKAKQRVEKKHNII